MRLSTELRIYRIRYLQAHRKLDLRINLFADHAHTPVEQTVDAYSALEEAEDDRSASHPDLPLHLESISHTVDLIPARNNLVSNLLSNKLDPVDTFELDRSIMVLKEALRSCLNLPSSHQLIALNILLNGAHHNSTSLIWL